MCSNSTIPQCESRPTKLNPLLPAWVELIRNWSVIGEFSYELFRVTQEQLQNSMNIQITNLLNLTSLVIVFLGPRFYMDNYELTCQTSFSPLLNEANYYWSLCILMLSKLDWEVKSFQLSNEEL